MNESLEPAVRPVCHECLSEVVGEVFALYIEHPTGPAEEVPVCRDCFYREHNGI